MSTIRRLTEKDMLAFAAIGANAYAGMKVTSDEDVKKMADRLWKIECDDPEINLYGLFRKGKLVGGMRLFDFTMRMLSTYIPVGGVGFIAVDLAHKKEHVCRELVEFYIAHYAKKKAPMLALYPFRPDFYRKMGFGYGTKINEYRIKPAELPAGGDKERVAFVTEAEHAALNECYHHVVDKTHGMFRRTKTYMGNLTRPGLRIAAFHKGKKIEGFVVFGLVPTNDQNWLVTELRCVEFIYENGEALSALSAFLRSQADQVGIVVVRLQDDDFHYVAHDPRNDSGRFINPVGHETNTQGLSIMYRVIDAPGLFGALKDHDFNGQNCRLKIRVQDSFYPRHDGRYLIHFVEGKPQVKQKGGYDVEIGLNVAEYSSMVMGVVPFHKLWAYGLAEISDAAYIETVTKIFAAPQRPYCVTQF